MALMNDNRLRIPQVAVLPASGDDDSIRGQMRMLDVAGNTTIMVCTTGDQDGVSTLVVGTLTYTSVPTSDAGELITVTQTLGAGPLSVSVIGDDIVVDGVTATTTETEVVDAITASAEASALVTVVTSSGASVMTAATIANLAGGAGTKAAQTYNTSLVVTAIDSGTAGNDITVAVVLDVDAAYTTAMVSRNGTAITIVGNASATTADMATAMSNNSNVTRLVTAVGSTDLLSASAAAALIGGASLSIWTSMAVA